jgi:glycosyltransferase involved in cell wall biosynthesis
MNDGVLDGTMRRLARLLLPDGALRSALRVRVSRLLRWVRPALGRPGAVPSATQRPLPASSLPDYIVWAVIDWHLRIQRPQHLALELARSGRRVFYVSCRLVDESVPGFRVEPLDGEGRLFQIFFQVRNAPQIYSASLQEAGQDQLRDGIRMLLDWGEIVEPISLVEHPFWFGAARSVPGGHLIYDRMDLHEGFGTFSEGMGEAERELMSVADLTIVSSAWLDEDSARYTERRMMLRNAGEFEHFAPLPEAPVRDTAGRRIIGYYGAIAGWMDLDLVEAVAARFSDCLIMLVGHDQCRASSRLRRFRNVRLTGEVPYDQLPRFLHGFDVCILPFKVIPLTEATNPVKIYEYLSAGKPVVAVDLPEMSIFGDLVHLASGRREFLEAIAVGLAEPADSPQRRRRRWFSERQTWAHRAALLIAEVESLGTSTARTP